MKRFKEVIFPILLTALLMGASIFFPLIYFQVQNRVLLNSTYPRKEIQGKIDPQAEDIYLVQAIQQLYQDGMNLDVDTVGKEQPVLQQAFRQQLEDMITAGILDASASSLYQEDGSVRVSTVNSNGLVMDRYMIIPSGETEQLDNCYFQPEEKTGKLLYFGVGRRNQALAGGSVSEISKRYIQYLGLETLNDWKETEGGMISQKAQLRIFCLQTKNFFILQISPINYFLGENMTDPLSYFNILFELNSEDDSVVNSSQ